MSITTDNAAAKPRLAGLRVALVGKFAGMSRRDVQKLVREHGAVAVERADESAQLIVVGEKELPLDDAAGGEGLFDESIRRAHEAGRLAIIGETELWRRLGLVDESAGVRRLYTPAMLADLLGVPVAVVRRWHRRGLIVPAREVRRLAYFDFEEVATARSLAQLLSSGISPAALEKKLAALARFLPGAERRLAQLSIIVEGKQILLRQGDGLIDPGGQLRFDFEPGGTANEERGVRSKLPTFALAGKQPVAPGQNFALAGKQPVAPEQNFALSGKQPVAPEQNFALADKQPVAPLHRTSHIEHRTSHILSPSCGELASAAADLEDEGKLEEAAEMYRAALAAGGPNAEINFRLAELLYRAGDVPAARERYYMAVELDEDLVEARANLGCVLAETGQWELAVAAFEGALAYHPAYADVHYHLARTLDELGRAAQAKDHWRAFVEIAPDSPWAHEARARLADADRS